MNRCAALMALLLPCLGAACSNFGTLALPEHAHLDRRALDATAELPTVHLIAGTPVTAVRYAGSGAPMALWIVTAEPGLVACQWHADGRFQLVVGTGSADRRAPGSTVTSR